MSRLSLVTSEWRGKQQYHGNPNIVLAAGNSAIATPGFTGP